MNAASESRIFEIGPPWIFLAGVDSQEFRDVLSSQREANGIVIELDCSEMLDLGQLFDAFATSAQFPEYFGKNWPAFDDCLSDLEWLPAFNYVIILRNPQRLLEQEPAELAAFGRIIGKVAAEWAEQVSLGEWWDRPGIPFHVVLDLLPNIVLAEGKDTLSVAGIEAELLTARR